ncbi:MAG: aminotransferase class I/II-fold pyridoxal phosphate-dependent enzyme [Thermoflexales bacterium]|nr:aminotransferase class I/II-fold pyridoxal phosphate-dependent enzyme [Thermoflexales bacterium]
MRQVLSDRVRSVPPSGIRKFFDIAAAMKDVISLGVGEPDFVTPDHILQAGVAALQQGETHYTSNSGTLELRQAVAGYLKRLYGLDYDPEKELLITVGVSEAMYLGLTATINPGDEVIVPQPCFVSYCPEVIFNGGVAVTIDTRVEDAFQVTAAQIEAKITPRTKALLIGYPNNPTGAVLSRERMLEIAALAEKHDLLVISDEIYDRLVYGMEHTCFASLPGMRERTIMLGGVSKSHAMTGWRIGYSAAPEELSAAMRKVHQYTIMSAPTMSQAAAVQALLHGEEDVACMTAEYDRRRRFLVGGLNQIGLKCFEPRGAFYAFPSVEVSGMNDETFAETLLREEQVAVVPGNAFGEPTGQYVRMCYATAYEKLERALERMERFVRRHG